MEAPAQLPAFRGQHRAAGLVLLSALLLAVSQAEEAPSTEVTPPQSLFRRSFFQFPEAKLARAQQAAASVRYGVPDAYACSSLTGPHCLYGRSQLDPAAELAVVQAGDEAAALADGEGSKPVQVQVVMVQPKRGQSLQEALRDAFPQMAKLKRQREAKEAAGSSEEGGHIAGAGGQAAAESDAREDSSAGSSRQGQHVDDEDEPSSGAEGRQVIFEGGAEALQDMDRLVEAIAAAMGAPNPDALSDKLKQQLARLVTDAEFAAKGMLDARGQVKGDSGEDQLESEQHDEVEFGALDNDTHEYNDEDGDAEEDAEYYDEEVAQDSVAAVAGPDPSSPAGVRASSQRHRGHPEQWAGRPGERSQAVMGAPRATAPHSSLGSVRASASRVRSTTGPGYGEQAPDASQMDRQPQPAPGSAAGAAPPGAQADQQPGDDQPAES